MSLDSTTTGRVNVLLELALLLLAGELKVEEDGIIVEFGLETEGALVPKLIGGRELPAGGRVVDRSLFIPAPNLP